MLLHELGHFSQSDFKPVVPKHPERVLVQLMGSFTFLTGRVSSLGYSRARRL